MIIKGKFVYLKKISLKDDKFIFNLRNKKDVSNYLHSPPKSINEQKKWILNNIKNVETLDFIICRNKDKKKIGTIAFDKINRFSAEWGRWISLGNIFENIESVIILLNYGFNSLKFKNIYSLTNKDNIKVVNFHKNSLALYKGTLKSFFKINNKSKDAIKYNFNKKRFNNFKKKFKSMIVSIQL
jgi:RimJ/RimL family protein N-acetyltransferase